MGDVIHLACDRCDLEDDYSVGWGMAMIGYELYVCDGCHDLVEVERDAHDPDAFEEAPTCGHCGGPIAPLLQPASDPDPEDWVHPYRDVRCPRCQGTLRIERVGIWD